MNDALSLVYFPAAVLLGALHALEPGHAKALTAAYLIGIKGTKRDSIVLGLSVALTHSIVVIAISVMGLWLGREAFAGQAAHDLELASGLVAMLIGSWMLWRRLSVKFKAPAQEAHLDPTHDHAHDHHDEADHAHLDDLAHEKAHLATLPEYTKTGERPSLGQIMLFGAAGGMIPCPASITVMLLALSTGKAGMGIFTVLGFSLGLALALVGIGLVVVSGLSKLSQKGRFSKWSKKAPVISAGLVILSGFFALVIALRSHSA